MALKNHELVHNYVLMGLSHAEQTQIEDAYWAPIEQNTGQDIDGFLRDYQTRDFENVEVPGRREFVGTVGPEAVRTRYVGKSVRTCFSRGAQNPITYVNIPI